mmetsp:Transcript_12121/g.37930  ORF Transcript_12121/g.37930 Transcript_12121/m.37930 type:complete len:225 (-) Transcript_12121:647-1321(-)
MHRAPMLQHGLLQIRIQQLWLGVQEVPSNCLQEAEPEYVHDEHQHQDRPEEGPHRPHDRVQHDPELPEELHHPDHAQHLEHLQEPQDPHPRHVHAKTRGLPDNVENNVIHCSQKQKCVQEVPELVLVAEKPEAEHLELQEELQGIKCGKGVAQQTQAVALQALRGNGSKRARRPEPLQDLIHLILCGVAHGACIDAYHSCADCVECRACDEVAEVRVFLVRPQR